MSEKKTKKLVYDALVVCMEGFLCGSICKSDMNPVAKWLSVVGISRHMVSVGKALTKSLDSEYAEKTEGS